MPVKQDEKKQHFDNIYVEKTPVPYKTEILDRLEYISDDNNRFVFDRLIIPWVKTQQDAGIKLNYVDLCAWYVPSPPDPVNVYVVANDVKTSSSRKEPDSYKKAIVLLCRVLCILDSLFMSLRIFLSFCFSLSISYSKLHLFLLLKIDYNF